MKSISPSGTPFLLLPCSPSSHHLFSAFPVRRGRFSLCAETSSEFALLRTCRTSQLRHAVQYFFFLSSTMFLFSLELIIAYFSISLFSTQLSLLQSRTHFKLHKAPLAMFRYGVFSHGSATCAVPAAARLVSWALPSPHARPPFALVPFPALPSSSFLIYSLVLEERILH